MREVCNYALLTDWLTCRGL